MLQIGQIFSLEGKEKECREYRYSCVHWEEEDTDRAFLLTYGTNIEYIIIKIEGEQVYFDKGRNGPEYRTAYIMNIHDLMAILRLEEIYETYEIY